MKEPTIVWRDDRAGNHFIFQSQVVFREASGILKSVPLIIMADTGASCSVFDLAFVEKNGIPWRKRQNPIRIVSASGTRIPHGGKAISSDCSVVVKDSDSDMDRVIPTVTEIFNLEEGIDLILGMDWLRANATGISWDISDRINFRPGVGLSEGANTERLVAQDGWAKLEGEVAFEGLENLDVNVDIQIVSSLSDWDDVVANGLAVGCIWYAGGESVATLWTDKHGKSVKDQLLPQYRRFAKLFSREEQSRLLEHSPWNIEIDLEPGKQPPSGHLYPLSHNELEALREYIDEMLKTGKIRPSKGSAGAPVFFVPKTHGRGLRVVVDYRGLNAITIKDRYPLPLMSELMDRVG